MKKTSIKKEHLRISYKDREIMEQNFYKFSENGTLLTGLDGFLERCTSRDFDVQKKFENYIKIQKHIEKAKNTCGFIDGTAAFKKNVITCFLDKVYYADQYNRMEFGR